MLSLVIEPGKVPYQKEIKNDIQCLQEEVGGYIECLRLTTDPVVIIVNEDGKQFNLPLNRPIYGPNKEVVEILRGNMVIVGVREGEFVSLSNDMMKKYSNMYSKPAKFVQAGDFIFVV